MLKLWGGGNVNVLILISRSDELHCVSILPLKAFSFYSGKLEISNDINLYVDITVQRNRNNKRQTH